MYSFKDHCHEIKDKRLLVTLTSGNVYEGDFMGVYLGLEIDEEYDFMDLDIGKSGMIFCCSEDEIDSIEVLGEID